MAPPPWRLVNTLYCKCKKFGTTFCKELRILDQARRFPDFTLENMWKELVKAYLIWMSELSEDPLKCPTSNGTHEPTDLGAKSDTSHLA